jgi:hypothetical protein
MYSSGIVRSLQGSDDEIVIPKMLQQLEEIISYLKLTQPEDFKNAGSVSVTRDSLGFPRV